MAVNDDIKRCSKCGEIKPTNLFSRRGTGFASYCKPCHSAYAKAHYQDNRQSVIASTKKWREENRVKYLANSRDYYSRNKEKNLAQSKKWASENKDARKRIWTKYRTEKKDRAKAAESAYRERNRLACNERIRKWKEENKDLLAYYSRTRHANLINATPPWADLDAIKEIYRKAAALRSGTGQNWHVDHIVPLLGKTVRGLHCEANLQIVPATINLRKNIHRWPDMP